MSVALRSKNTTTQPSHAIPQMPTWSIGLHRHLIGLICILDALCYHKAQLGSPTQSMRVNWMLPVSVHYTCNQTSYMWRLKPHGGKGIYHSFDQWHCFLDFTERKMFTSVFFPSFLFLSFLTSFPLFFFSLFPYLKRVHLYKMSSSTTDIAERTAAARREAEQLKDKIKQKKESLADTTRKYTTIDTNIQCISFVYTSMA